MRGELLSKKGTRNKVFVYGGLSAVFDAALFMNAGAVTKSFTEGIWYTALPILAGFIFLNGMLARELWSYARTRSDARKEAQKRKPTHQRARAQAYINPWHKM